MSVVTENQKAEADIVLKYCIRVVGGQCASVLSATKKSEMTVLILAVFIAHVFAPFTHL